MGVYTALDQQGNYAGFVRNQMSPPYTPAEVVLAGLVSQAPLILLRTSQGNVCNCVQWLGFWSFTPDQDLVDNWPWGLVLFQGSPIAQIIALQAGIQQPAGLVAGARCVLPVTLTLSNRFGGD